MSGPVRRLRACMVAGTVVLLVLPALAASQELTPGSPQIGVRIQLLDQPYTVNGSTAIEIRDQMRVLRAGSGLMGFSYSYSWDPHAERLILTNGSASDFCRVRNFEVRFDVTVMYPRWDPPTGASDRLVAAWAEFSSQLVQYWEQFRDRLLDRGKEMVTRFRDYEELCSFINGRVGDRVREEFGEPNRRTDDEPRVSLQWPPEGYGDLMRPPSPPVTVAEPPPPRPTERSARPAIPPARVLASDIDAAARLDLGRAGAVQVVVALHHEGERQFRESYPLAGRAGDDPLTPGATFAFPAFTEVLIATLSSSLSVKGVIDLAAPLADHLPGLPQGLGATTLDQLLSHRAGLDNASVADTADWAAVMDKLDDGALFTEPGAVFSYSRYSYPLAVRVIEAATGRTVEEAIAESVLRPLGLDLTTVGPRDAEGARDGLPVTYTSDEEIIQFWTAWLDGKILGAQRAPFGESPAAVPSGDERRFVQGVWRDRVGTVPRISLMCGASPTGYAAGFQIYPETRTIMVFWSRYDAGDSEFAGSPPSATRWPMESTRFVVSRVAGALDLGDEAFGPTRLDGGGQLTLSPRRCAEPALSSERVEDFGPPTPSGDWPGVYVNGDRLFQLEEVEGMLTSRLSSSGPQLRVRHYGDDIYFTEASQLTAIPTGFAFRLIRDEAGRRYVMVADRAYLHQDDRGPAG